MGSAPGKNGTHFCSYLKFRNFYFSNKSFSICCLLCWISRTLNFFFKNAPSFILIFRGQDLPGYFAIIANSWPGHLLSQIPVSFHLFCFSLYLLLIVHTHANGVRIISTRKKPLSFNVLFLESSLLRTFILLLPRVEINCTACILRHHSLIILEIPFTYLLIWIMSPEFQDFLFVVYTLFMVEHCLYQSFLFFSC